MNQVSDVLSFLAWIAHCFRVMVSYISFEFPLDLEYQSVIDTNRSFVYLNNCLFPPFLYFFH